MINKDRRRAAIKIIIDEIADLSDIEIHIKCAKITEEIEAAVAQLRMLGKQKTVTGKIGEEIYFLDYKNVDYKEQDNTPPDDNS